MARWLRSPAVAARWARTTKRSAVGKPRPLGVGRGGECLGMGMGMGMGVGTGVGRRYGHGHVAWGQAWARGHRAGVGGRGSAARAAGPGIRLARRKVPLDCRRGAGPRLAAAGVSH
jgi:hypothetical protein